MDEFIQHHWYRSLIALKDYFRCFDSVVPEDADISQLKNRKQSRHMECIIPIDDVFVLYVVERLNDFELDSDDAPRNTRLFGKLGNFVITIVSAGIGRHAQGD